MTSNLPQNHCWQEKQFSPHLAAFIKLSRTIPSLEVSPFTKQNYFFWQEWIQSFKWKPA